MVSDSQISLSWNDNADNETASEIERQVDGDGWSAHDSLGANVTNYSDSGLTADTTYSYRVRATNGSGDSGWSNSDSATTPGELPYNDNLSEMDLPVIGYVSNTVAPIDRRDSN